MEFSLGLGVYEIVATTPDEGYAVTPGIVKAQISWLWINLTALLTLLSHSEGPRFHRRAEGSRVGCLALYPHPTRTCTPVTHAGNLAKSPEPARLIALWRGLVLKF